MLSTTLFAIGCRFPDRHMTVQETMTWACAPDRVTRDYPEAQAVRLRFVDNPAYEEVVFGKGLCESLSSAKSVVTVEFNVSGNSHQGLVGYHVVSIDGKKVVRVGGFNTSSVIGRAGPHPLSEHFR